MNNELQILSAEFFRTLFSIRHSQFSIATAPLFFHTAFRRPLLRASADVFEKNYRLQDIQLSKNTPSRSRASAKQARDSRRRTRSLISRLPSRSRFDLAYPSQAPGRRRLVENTGLEPVTSWLQTRRSPS